MKTPARIKTSLQSRNDNGWKWNVQSELVHAWLASLMSTRAARYCRVGCNIRRCGQQFLRNALLRGDLLTIHYLHLRNKSWFCVLKFPGLSIVTVNIKGNAQNWSRTLIMCFTNGNSIVDILLFTNSIVDILLINLKRHTVDSPFLT